MSDRQLILGSGSPRRRELLELFGLPFEVSTADIDEIPAPGESAEEFVSRMALEKGREVASRHGNAVVVAADTVVVLDGAILGKPADTRGAREMLRSLSGREHRVMTAVAVIDAATGNVERGLEETRVWFRVLEAWEIDEYVARENLLDKAGAYAIQGLAALFIPRIEGNYSNVVGFPLPLVADLLGRQGVRWRGGS